MDYKHYLALQNRIEWLYDFHPEFFSDLTEQDRSVLHEGLLYDVSDAEYPDSIEQFYETTIKSNTTIQDKILEAAQRLYDISGSGKLDLEN